MAAPPTVDIRDLSGQWTMNKTLSDPSDPILAAQGVSYLKRTAISMGYITLAVKHYRDGGAEKIDIDQTIVGSFGTSERRILDGTEREHEDQLFGAVISKSKREQVGNVEHEFLRKGWTNDTIEHGVVYSYVESDRAKSGTTWVAIQTWGFQTIDGERRYCRNVYFTGPSKKVIEARLVYDYRRHPPLLNVNGKNDGIPCSWSNPESKYLNTSLSYLMYNYESDLAAVLSQLKSFISLTVTMTEAGSNISPSTSQVSVAASQPKVSRESFQVDNLPLTPSQLPWYKRIDRHIASSYPRLHERALKVVKYVRGPNPKIILSDPDPWFNFKLSTRRGTVQLSLESTLLQATRRLTSPWLLLLLGAAYIVALAFLSRFQSFRTPDESWLECNSAYWAANNGCGMDGLECGPFENSTFDFRCPAQCNSVILLNPRTVGGQQTVFKPLIVGGGDENKTYRGDSFICAAALHAGVISGSKGGCGSLQLIGNFTDFLPSTANGLTSVSFPTIFPLSFQFLPTTSLHGCDDIRNPALAFNIIITCLLFLVLRPRPIIVFWCLAGIGFWHVSLFSQVRSNPPAIDEAFGTFLPTLFVCYAFWRLAFRFTLPAFSKAPIEAMVWYLAPYWAGVLANFTFNKIPIDRLTASDLTKRTGAITALVVILIIVTAAVVNQIRVIRKTGWLAYYFGWYVLGGLVILVVSQLPGLQLRLHHYIVAILLIPCTALPTRLSAIYQGFLLGMFLNGVAAFGFDSILQTTVDLRRDAPLGSSLPSFQTNSSSYNSTIPFNNQSIFWNVLPQPIEGADWDGFSLLVDDVERYYGPALNFSLAALKAGIPHFFRLAFTSRGQAGDFTKGATLWPNGTWVDPPPGPS